MKQIPLDIGLTPRPRLHTLVEGENGRLLAHVREALQQRQPQTVPTYVWGPAGSGKTHLLQAVLQELHEQGLSAGWLDASTPCGGYAREFDPRWSAVLLDEVELYSPEQQHTAFNWFINAMTPQQGEPRWVLAAGSLPVADLPLREDLRTRLGWGQGMRCSRSATRACARRCSRARPNAAWNSVTRWSTTCSAAFRATWAASMNCWACSMAMPWNSGAR